MEQQKTLLDDSFESWRGQLEQIEDVCVIGVRIISVRQHKIKLMPFASSRALSLFQTFGASLKTIQ